MRRTKNGKNRQYPKTGSELPPFPKPVEEMTTAERVEHMDRMMAYLQKEKAQRRAKWQQEQRGLANR